MFLGTNNIIYNSLRIIAICYFFQISAFASEIIIKENMSEIALSGMGQEYRGKDWAEKELSDLESMPQDSFVKFNPGATRYGGWLKFIIKNESKTNLTKVLYLAEAGFRRVEFYVKSHKTANVRKVLAGTEIEIMEREFPVNYPSVEFTLKPGEVISLYAKFHINKNGVFNAYLGTVKDLISAAANESFVHNSIIGLIFALVCLQFFFYLKLRDPIYLVYVGYCISIFVIYAIQSVNYSLVFGKLDNLGELFNYTRLAANMFVVMMPLALFSAKERYPRFYKTGVILLSGIFLSFVFNQFLNFLPSKVLSDICHLISFSYILYFAFHAMLNKEIASKVFFAAWCIFMTGIVCWILKNNGILPVNYLTKYIGSATAALDIVLVSFAVAIKVKTSEDMRIIAERKAAESDNLRKLLRIVCHDISNPLTRASFAIETYKGEKTKNWDDVDRSIGIVTNIISKVKSYEFARSKKENLKLGKVGIKDSLEEINFIFTPILQEKNITLETNIQADSVLADPVSFTNEVLANLISNAIKFSEAGSIIKLSSELNNHGKVILKVTDTGAGIDESTLKSIFNSYRSLSKPGTNGEKGTGFGLPIVKSYVEFYGGKITVETKEKDYFPNNHGTTFILELENYTNG